jgi:hypothetical protein
MSEDGKQAALMVSFVPTFESFKELQFSNEVPLSQEFF